MQCTIEYWTQTGKLDPGYGHILLQLHGMYPGECDVKHTSHFDYDSELVLMNVCILAPNLSPKRNVWAQEIAILYW